MLLLVVVMLVVMWCCPTTVALPAAGEMVWLRGPTHVVKEATSTRWDTHTPGKHLLDRDSLGLGKIGGRRPGLLGNWGRVVGKRHLELLDSPGLQPMSSSTRRVRTRCSE